MSMVFVGLAGLLTGAIFVLNTLVLVHVNHDLGVVCYIITLVGGRILYFAMIEAELEHGRIITRIMELCCLMIFLGLLLTKQSLLISLPYLIGSTLCRWSDLLLSHPHLEIQG